MGSIKIGPAFFAKEKNDYQNWRFAWIRELVQNGSDAPGTDTIEFNFKFDGTHTIASCTNNGSPMTKNILVEKFLAIGESGKNFMGTVGGFGKAKTLIAFTHDHYNIRTGTLEVDGEGAQYTLSEDHPYFHGTTTTVKMRGDETDKLLNEAKRFVAYAQWDGIVRINGTNYECDMRKGSPRKSYDWGTVYTNKTIPNRVIVRVGGIPMFSEYTSFDRTVIVELAGASVDVLTSNRDGLSGKYEDEFQEFLTDLITNKSKALKASSPSYTRFSGAKYAHRKTEAVKASARSIVGDTEPRTAKERLGTTIAAFVGGQNSPSSSAGGSGGHVLDSSRIGVAVQQTEEMSEVIERVVERRITPVSTIAEEFILKNDTTLKIPDYYRPDCDQFGTYSRKLARIWGRLMLELHRKYELETEFSIGFVFSEDAEAEHEDGSYGTVYYLNPAKIVEQQASASKSFKKRFALTERNRLLSIAVHEFLHGLGFRYHDENFAAKLTDMMGQIMDDRKRFNWCFS